jgi:hypothetical protein
LGHLEKSSLGAYAKVVSQSTQAVIGWLLDIPDPLGLVDGGLVQVDQSNSMQSRFKS